MKKANPDTIAKTAACFRPPRNEFSCILPARIPPKNASRSAVCRKTLRAVSGVRIGLIRPDPPTESSLIGTNIMFEISIIINRKITTEK